MSPPIKKWSGSLISSLCWKNLAHNLRLVDALAAQAVKKGCTPAQLSIAWVGALGEKVIPLPGSSCVGSFVLYG